jgi:hypothetical protein
MKIHSQRDVLENSRLLKEITAYSKEHCQKTGSNQSAAKPSSVFLTINAAAEYYSANETLMQFPPNVVAEISE